MRARVPNFVSNGNSGGFNNNNNNNNNNSKKTGGGYVGGGLKENLHQMNGGVKGKLHQRNVLEAARNAGSGGSQNSPMSNSNSAPNLAQLPGAAHPFWWHSRLYPDNGGMYL